MIDKNDEKIQITMEEAESDHVDALLNRQKSLRGEGGGHQKTKGRWYLQNWAVFGAVGMIAAILTWAFIEPNMDDFLYLQGPIESMDLENPKTLTVPSMTDGQVAEVPVMGWIKIGGQTIWLGNRVNQIYQGKTEPLADTALGPGAEVGVYVEYLAIPSATIILAGFIVLDPGPPPTKASESLEEQNKRDTLFSFLLFPLLAAFVGLALGAAEGLICRQISRAMLSGLIGLLVGFIGGFIAFIPSNVIYEGISQWLLSDISENGMNATEFLFQISARSLAWAAAGMAMGLGQGIALRSKSLLIYGFLGGVIGGLLGGLFFDPIDLILLGSEKPSAHWSRLVGFAVIGLSVGVMIGVVELLARDAWLRMTRGPLAGKEFHFFKEAMKLGSSPKNEIYLFNDPEVLGHHATLRAVGEVCEIESMDREHQVLINDRPVHRTRLRNGDRVTLGGTSFIFHRKRRRV